MKVSLFLMALVAMATSEAVFDNCTTTMVLPKTVNLAEVMGAWYEIRKGPTPDFVKKSGSFDCMKSAVWQESDGPTNVINVLHRVRKDEKQCIGKTLKMDVTPVGTDPKVVNNNFQVTKNFHLLQGGDTNVDMQSKLVETNNGLSWSLWVGCLTKDNNSTIVWSIKSRYPALDAKEEDMIMEKIEKYGGIQRNQLCGVGHVDCYKPLKQ